AQTTRAQLPPQPRVTAISQGRRLSCCGADSDATFWLERLSARGAPNPCLTFNAATISCTCRRYEDGAYLPRYRRSYWGISSGRPRSIGQLPQDINVPHHHRGPGHDVDGRAPGEQDFQDLSRDLVSTFRGLIWIRRRPEMNFLTRPRTLR